MIKKLKIMPKLFLAVTLIICLIVSLLVFAGCTRTDDRDCFNSMGGGSINLGTFEEYLTLYDAIELFEGWYAKVEYGQIDFTLHQYFFVPGTDWRASSILTVRDGDAMLRNIDSAGQRSNLYFRNEIVYMRNFDPPSQFINPYSQYFLHGFRQLLLPYPWVSYLLPIYQLQYHLSSYLTTLYRTSNMTIREYARGYRIVWGSYARVWTFAFDEQGRFVGKTSPSIATMIQPRHGEIDTITIDWRRPELTFPSDLAQFEILES